jgi:hypothetical protein
MARTHRCSGNDHISKIAADNNFRDWETVWNANRQLQRRRNSPNLLFKGDRRVRRGDRLQIPNQERREEAAATEADHEFEARDAQLFVRLRILKPDFTALSGAQYRATIAGVPDPYEGTTGSNGEIELGIPRAAQRGELVVRVPAAATDSGGSGGTGAGATPDGGEAAAPSAESAGEGSETELRGDVPVTWELQIGALNPILERAPDQNCVSGVQQRLNNLALYTGGIDGGLGETTRAAIRQFQRIFGIDPQTGNPDQAETQTRLRDVHDSVEGSQPPADAAGAEQAAEAPAGGEAAAPGAGDAPAAPGGGGPGGAVPAGP